MLCHRLYDKYGRTYLLEIKYWYIGVPKDLPLDELPPEEEDAKFVVDAYHAGNVRSHPLYFVLSMSNGLSSSCSSHAIWYFCLLFCT